MTKLSKWLLYAASYKWVYLLQIVSIVYLEINESPITSISCLWKMILNTGCLRKIAIVTLLVLFILAGFIQKKFRQGKHNARIKYLIEENVVFEIALSVIAYLATVLSITLNTYGIIIVMVVFWGLGWIVDVTDSIYVPVFFLTGYRVYKSDKVKIITKMSRDQYRLKLDDAIDGLEARELVRNVYIIFDYT